MWPVVSPDGARLAFVRAPALAGDNRQNGNFDVFYVNLADPRYNPVQVTRHASAEAYPSWTPTSDGLYYASDRLKTLSVWRTAIEGPRGDIQITGRDAHDLGPALSPDGTKIVFGSYGSGPGRFPRECGAKPCLYPARRPDATEVAPSIWIANADGTQLTQVAVAGFAPKWTPDGKKILYYASTGENFDIWVMNPDGSQPTQLTSDPADEIEAAMSPDMGTLVYAAYDRPRRNFDIWAINLRETGGQTQLTFDCEDDRAPAWGTDGTLYFQSRRVSKQWDIFGGRPQIPWRR
jgi:Tol biopolymer transport system component